MPTPKLLTTLALALLVGLPSSASDALAAAQSRGRMLCAGKERLFFGAVTTSGKMVCLCGSPNLTAEQGYLQYRFGRPGRVELEYPTERAGSQRLFYYAHYARYQREWASVRFKNNEYNYRIYYSYDGEAGRPTIEYGLSVYLGEGDKGTNFLLRRNTVVGALQSLGGVLPCDREDTLTDCP
ncbi:MAG: hypothetical protein NZ585_12535 [Chloracidobacterium sp.]|nr:hypothetical protein [Chloracidobacterium sp.]MDW8216253.1 hypothetical protein [Acidobacteriota bacterium]